MAIYLLNFRPQFAQAVRDGSKHQTIRRHRADGKRLQVGDTVKLYTGLRTRHAQLLREAPVTGAFSLRMDLADGDVVIDGCKLDQEQRSGFAIADGFEHWPAMLAWFVDTYGADTGRLFEGYLVTWSVA